MDENNFISQGLAKKLAENNCELESEYYWVMWSSECGGNGNYFLIDKSTFIKNEDA